VRTTAVTRSVDDRDVRDRERSALRQRGDANADGQHCRENKEAVSLAFHFGTWHRRSGLVFVHAMIATGITATGIAMVD
jgi:hypothetical protein